MLEHKRTREETERLMSTRLARLLELNDNQSKELGDIQAKYPEAYLNPDLDELREEGEKQVSELAEKFDEESFDATKLPYVSASAKATRARAEREVERFKALLPSLSPAQRAKLADYAEHGFPQFREPPHPPAVAAAPAATP